MYLLFETSPGWLQGWRVVVFFTSIWRGSTLLQCIYYLRRVLISIGRRGYFGVSNFRSCSHLWGNDKLSSSYVKTTISVQPGTDISSKWPFISVFQCSTENTPTSWWRHQMETFSALLAICAGTSPGPGEFPAQRPETRSFDVFFDLRLNKRLSKQSWGWWFKTLSHPIWRLRNVVMIIRSLWK